MTEATEAPAKTTRAKTQTTTGVPAIYAAIAAIQKDIPTLQKNGVGPSSQGGYKFLSVDDVLHAIKPLFDTHGVIVSPELVKDEFWVSTANAKDNERVPRSNISARVTYRFRFIAVSDGSHLDTVVIGEGTDTQDKAVRKATTSAWKIALIQTFALITGEIDPDGLDGGAANNEAGATSNPQANRALSPKATAATPAGPSPVAALRNAIKEAAAARGIDGAGYIKLGNEKFAPKDQSEWTANQSNLTDLLKAIEAGETA